MGTVRRDGWVWEVRLCNWRNEKWRTAITSLSSIGKSSAVTFSWLNEVQILNRCFTAEMILTDKAIVVTSNCFLWISFSELPLYVSHWQKIVPTVIPYFVSQNLLPAVNFAPLPSLPPSPSLSLIVFCPLFLPPNELSLSFASLIYPFILLLQCRAQLFICTIVFLQLKHCFDPLCCTPSQWKQETDQNTNLSVVCEFKPNKEDK